MKIPCRLCRHLMAALVLCGSVSCTHKELCYDHSHKVSLNVVFDWQYAPDADPGSMALFLYPRDGGMVLRYDFTVREGGRIEIPKGVYDTFCINSDTQDLSYRNMESFQTFEVTTLTTELLGSLSGIGVRSNGAPRAKGTEDERVALPAEMIWSNCTEEVSLLEEQGQLTLLPRVAVKTYTFEIHNVQNIKYLSGVSASLSSMSGSFLPGLGHTSEERVTIPFEMTPNREQ